MPRSIAKEFEKIVEHREKMRIKTDQEQNFNKSFRIESTLRGMI